MSERLYKGGSTTMRRNLLLAVSLAICSLMPAASFAAGRKPTSCDTAGGVNINVRSFFNTDTNNLPFQLQSDTNEPYVTYTNSKTDSVVSEIQANSCDWVLDLGNSQNRMVHLTLAYPYSGPHPLPFGAEPVSVAAYIISKCWKNPANNGLSYGTMTYEGQTLECGFSAAFNYYGNTYAVRMNPNNWAGTTWVEVKCAGAISSQCNSWTVKPIPGLVTNSGTGQSSAVGQLTQITTKGTTVETPLGLYYVDFSASITK